MDPSYFPFKTAYYPDLGLHIPLAHLLGNKIGIYLEDTPETLTGRRLQISAWKLKEEAKQLHKGRFHISPVGFAKISLIEDIVRPANMPKDFPIVSERTTQKNLVNTSLFYPSSMEIWNFRIHLDYANIVEDNECVLLREEVLGAGSGWTNWTRLELADYNNRKAITKEASPRLS